MSQPQRYIRGVRRTSLLVASLLGLTTLFTGTLAIGAPPKHPPRAYLAPVVADPDDPPPAAPAGKHAAAKPAADAAAAKTDDPIERARRGVVVLERGGEILGLGSVLAKDGRILTALSPLGNGNNINVRYADGSVVHAKVGHSERLWDLALLVPQAGKWSEGLAASDDDALKQGAQLRVFAPGRNKLQPASLLLKGRRSLLGADETMLRDVFDVGTKIGPKEFGGPILDENGNVAAVLGRACVPVEKGPCAPTAFGIPVDAVRSFLRTVPPSAISPAGFLGIQGVADKVGPASGVRVTSVSPESPADEGGLKASADKALSDLIVAVDDQPVPTPAALARVIHEKSVGDHVKLLLFSGGKFREAFVVLRPAPGK